MAKRIEFEIQVVGSTEPVTCQGYKTAANGLAAHRARETGGKVSQNRWQLTHVGTGLAVFGCQYYRVKTLRACLAIAKELAPLTDWTLLPGQMPMDTSNKVREIMKPWEH